MNGPLNIAAEGRAKDLVRDLRCRSLYSNYFFVKAVLNYPELTDYFHQPEMEDFIGRWSRGERKQWIEWSRGFFKSTCFTIGTSIWVTLPYTSQDSDYAINHLGISEADWFSRMGLHNQNVRQLLAFETSDNAVKKLGEIQWHFESNELFRSLFPEIAYTGQEPTWNSQCLMVRRTAEGARHQEGTFEAIGVGGALQSRHYDVVWEDDLVGKAAVESEAVMEKTIRWHGLLHGCFVDAARQVRFGVSNRWGYADLNSYIAQNEPDFVFHTQSCSHFDPESGEEVATFPVDGRGKERFTLEALEKIRSSGSMTSYDFSCQYRNSPKLPGENEVSLAQLHKYTVQNGQIHCSCGTQWWPEQLLISMHYDPYNAKGTSSHSCPCIVVVGTSPDEHVFLLDYWLNKGVYDQVFKKLYSYNDQWRPYLFTYEDVAHQNMDEFHIRETEKNPLHKKEHRKFPRIQAVPTKGKAKEVRIRSSFLPYIDRGLFSCRASHLTFLEMLETFPNKVLSHDYDLLDCLAQGATVWRFPGSEEYYRKEDAEEARMIKQLGMPYSHMAERRA